MKVKQDEKVRVPVCWSDYFYEIDSDIYIVGDFGTLQPLNIEQIVKVGLFLAPTLPNNYFYK